MVPTSWASREERAGAWEEMAISLVVNGLRGEEVPACASPDPSSPSVVNVRRREVETAMPQCFCREDGRFVLQMALTMWIVSLF
eukprot:6204320-Pleurochrysis_carterae.AAC.2